jgi:hypothetical protein
MDDGAKQQQSYGSQQQRNSNDGGECEIFQCKACTQGNIQRYQQQVIIEGHTSTRWHTKIWRVSLNIYFPSTLTQQMTADKNPIMKSSQIKLIPILL